METKERLNFIYILKFISAIIIAVFLHWNDHFISNLGLPNIFTNKMLIFLTKKTYVLVELFFILSGLLYFVTSNEKIKRGKVSFKDFFVKKMGRLLPVIIVTTIFMFLCNLFLFLSHKPAWSCDSISLFDVFLNFFSGRVIFSNLNVLNGNIWYVSILFLCYIIAFYLSKKSNKRGDIVFIIPIIISIIMFYSLLDIIPFFNFSVVRGLSGFFIGIYIGKFLNLYNNFSLKYKIWTKIISFIFLISFVVCFYFNLLDNIYTPPTFSYTLFVFAPLIIFLYGFNTLNKFFGLKVFKYLGNISYSIYIWNMPILITLHILYIYKKISLNVFSYKFFILLALIHIVVAIHSYLFIEKKYKNVKFNFLFKLIN